MQTAESPPVVETSTKETETSSETIESVHQDLDTSSSVDSQPNSLLLLDQDAPVDDIISDTFKDDKIDFDASSSLDLLTDDFSLNPLNEHAEQVIDDVIQASELKMDMDIIAE